MPVSKQNKIGQDKQPLADDSLSSVTGGGRPWMPIDMTFRDFDEEEDQKDSSQPITL